MTVVTPAQIAAKWIPLGFVSDEMVETGYQMCIAAAGGNTQLIVALELERKGGVCPFCDRPFRKIDLDTRYAKFSFYLPGCLCYRICRSCGTEDTPRYLVAERLLGISYCTSCHPKGIEPPRTAKRRKPGFRDGKAAAAGDEPVVGGE